MFASGSCIFTCSFVTATPIMFVSQNDHQIRYRNVVSFSDGEPGKGSGIPYFYLTTLDPTARNALKDQRASLTISEYPIGTCGKVDPENPTCAKITLTGKVCCNIEFIHYL